LRISEPPLVRPVSPPWFDPVATLPTRS
jgi:hypothetical protein